jgi:hypothetical protein
MAYSRVCKGCSADINLSSENINRMIDEIVNSENFKLVSEEAYEFRLQQCRNCICLDYGTTCKHCGCIVQVRALLKDKGCPHPGASRWKS